MELSITSAVLDPSRSNVVCAVGRLDQEEGRQASRVVWIRGGIEHPAVPVERDGADHMILVSLSAMHTLPSSLNDQDALLSNDMAAAISVAEVVTARRLKTVAVCLNAAATTTGFLLIQYLRAGDDCPDTTVVLFGPHSDEVVEAWEKAVPTVTLHGDNHVRESLLDGCVDLCCTTDSLAFATRQMEPLGTLVLLPTTAGNSAGESVQVDMNTVVINELSVFTVGSYRDELAKAVNFLSVHSASLQVRPTSVEFFK